MSYSHTVQHNWLDSAGRRLNASTTLTADSEDNRSVAIPIASDTAVDLYLRKLGLKILYILSDVAITLTFKDSTPSSVGSFAMGANVPYRWTADDNQTINPNPLSADAVTMHINAAATGTLELRLLQDSTP